MPRPRGWPGRGCRSAGPCRGAPRRPASRPRRVRPGRPAGRSAWKCTGSRESRAPRRWSSYGGPVSHGSASHRGRPSSDSRVRPASRAAAGVDVHDQPQPVQAEHALRQQVGRAVRGDGRTEVEHHAADRGPGPVGTGRPEVQQPGCAVPGACRLSGAARRLPAAASPQRGQDPVGRRTGRRRARTLSPSPGTRPGRSPRRVCKPVVRAHR